MLGVCALRMQFFLRQRRQIGDLNALLGAHVDFRRELALTPIW
jgi:hypothetical protein